MHVLHNLFGHVVVHVELDVVEVVKVDLDEDVVLVRYPCVGL